MIQFNQVSFKYQNGTAYVLTQFSLSIEEGKKVCILGESGCGKSTILRLLAGLEIPRAGSIYLNNRILSDKSTFVPPEKRGVGMVFQDYALFPHLTVEQNIGFGLRKLTKSQKEKLILETLEMFCLGNYGKQYPGELSGGQQQRVAIARALIMRPPVLMLDEPMSNLDVTLKNKIRRELLDILNQYKITTLLVTHDQEDCRFFAGEVIHIQNGNFKKAG